MTTRTAQGVAPLELAVIARGAPGHRGLPRPAPERVAALAGGEMAPPGDELIHIPGDVIDWPLDHVSRDVDQEGVGV